MTLYAIIMYIKYVVQHLTDKEIKMEKPFLEDHKADNGEHSHWNLIDSETGELLWTEDPEEEMAQNGRSVKRSHNSGYEAR